MDYYDEQPRNLEAEDLTQRIDDASDWFKEALSILYCQKPFDLVDLENALDELGSYLYVKLPKNELKLKIQD